MNYPTQKIPILKFLPEKKNPRDLLQTQIFWIKHLQESVLISSFKLSIIIKGKLRLLQLVEDL